MIDFDPYAVLQELVENQRVLNDNQFAHAKTIGQLITQVKQQQQQIDTLLAALDSANRANELMMSALVTDINNTLQGINSDKT
jgi:hypothetical protein